MQFQEMLKEEREEGRKEGREEGRKEGREEGRKEGGEGMLFNLLSKGKIDMETVAEELGISAEAFKKKMKSYSN